MMTAGSRVFDEGGCARTKNYFVDFQPSAQTNHRNPATPEHRQTVYKQLLAQTSVTGHWSKLVITKRA